MRKTLLQTAAQIGPAGRVAALTGLVALGACAQPDRLPGSAAGGTPDQIRALTVSGMAAQADPGLAAMRRAALAAPSDYALQARYAGALARAGELLMAEDIVVASLARAPDHPALNQQLARIRVRGGQPQVALALFDRAALLQPSAEAEEGRGIALDMLGRHDEAQAAYRAALLQSPNLVSAQNNLAMSLMLTGRANEAVAVLEPLSRRGDAPARVANNLAVARSMAGGAPRMDVAAVDPREVREMAANLRATVGAAPSQGAPASQFAAIEPGRGGATPILPMDAAARSGFAAAAVPLPSLPPLPGMPAALPVLPPAAAAPPAPQPATDHLMPAPLPPSGTVALPPSGTVALPPSGMVALPPVEAAPLARLAPAAEPAVALLPVPARPAAPPAPAAAPAVALAPASPAAAFAPMVITAVLLPSSTGSAAPAPRAPAVQAAALVVPAAPRAPAAEPAIAATPAPRPQSAAPAAVPAPRASTEAGRPMVVTAVVMPRGTATAPAARATNASVPAAAALAPRQSAATPQPASLSVPAPRRAPADQADAGGGHSVQVAALPSERAAQALWSRLRVQMPQEFGDRAPVIARADLPHGTFWRLRTSGFTSVTDARGFCQILRDHGRDCWVPTGN